MLGTHVYRDTIHSGKSEGGWKRDCFNCVSYFCLFQNLGKGCRVLI